MSKIEMLQKRHALPGEKLSCRKIAAKLREYYNTRIDYSTMSRIIKGFISLS